MESGKSKTVTVDLVMYPAGVTFIMGCSLQELKTKAKRLKQSCDFDPDDYDLTGGLCFKSMCGKYPLIWLEKLPDNPEAIGFLIHEISHAVILIADALGISISVINDEFFSYCSQYLTEQVLRAVT